MTALPMSPSVIRPTDAGARGPRTWLFVLVVGTMLLDLPLFAFLYVSGAFLPKYFAVVLGAVALAAGGARALPNGRVLAIAGVGLLYLCYCLLSFGWSSNADAAWRELITRATGIGILVMVAAVTVATRSNAQRRVIAGLACAAAASLLLDVLSGYPWSTTPGRASGFFANPNTAASTTSLLAILGVLAIPSRWRAAFLALITICIVSTLSRGGYLMIATSGMMLAWRGVVRIRSVVVAGAALALAALLAWPLILRSPLAERPEVAVISALSPRALLRLERGDATSASERQEVAAAAMDLFWEHPVRGAGLTATTTWTLPVSTHNQILRVAAELGLVGVAILVALLLAVVMGGRVWSSPEGPAAISWLLVILLVSHNVLDDWSQLAALGVLAGLNPGKQAVPPVTTESGNG